MLKRDEGEGVATEGAHLEAVAAEADEHVADVVLCIRNLNLVKKKSWIASIV